MMAVHGDAAALWCREGMHCPDVTEGCQGYVMGQKKTGALYSGKGKNQVCSGKPAFHLMVHAAGT